MVGTTKPDLELRAEVAETLLFSAREELNAALAENERLREQVALLSRELDKEDEDTGIEKSVERYLQDERAEGPLRGVARMIEKLIDSMRGREHDAVWVDEWSVTEPPPWARTDSTPPIYPSAIKNEEYYPPVEVTVRYDPIVGGYYVEIRMISGKNFSMRFSARDRSISEYELHDAVDEYANACYDSGYKRSQAKRYMMQTLPGLLVKKGARLWDDWQIQERL